MNRRTFLKSLVTILVASSIPIEVVSSPILYESKIELVRRLMQNGLDSHDRLIEEAIFGRVS